MSVRNLEAWSGDAGRGSDDAQTPTMLLGRVRAARAAADQAEVDVLLLAVGWAHAHPVLPADDRWHAPRSTAFSDGGPDDTADLEEHEWFGIPEVRWDAPAAFAAANSMSTAAGTALIRDALVLRHRLPRVFRRVVSGDVPVWRARRVAQAVLGTPRDVVAHVDAAVAALAHKVGAATLDRLLDEAMLELHPEQRELAQLEALDRRHATLDERSLSHTGVADLHVRGDWADLHDFDRALSQVAAALAAEGDEEGLDVRRSRAVGVLADPERALALLAGDPAPPPRRTIALHVHLSEAALRGTDVLARDESGRPWLESLVRDWCGRTDRHVSVMPVVDLNDHCDGSGHDGADPYVHSPALKELVALRDRTCVFPWCSRRARRCDADHITPHAEGGATCECNLAPLCRHHHRLKTHAGWRYLALSPGIYLWRDPHGQQLARPHRHRRHHRTARSRGLRSAGHLRTGAPLFVFEGPAGADLPLSA